MGAPKTPFGPHQESGEPQWRGRQKRVTVEDAIALVRSPPFSVDR
jgi:hypothetical protein